MITIALDFDGTLARSMDRWVDIYNHLYPQKKITIVDLNSWDFEKKLGITPEQKKFIFRKVWTDWREIKPEEPNQYYLTEKLNSLGDVDIVTTINPAFTQFAEKWAILHGISYNKCVSTGADEKETYPYDYFIDDNPEMAERIRKFPDKTQLLFNQNWNQHVDATGNVKRIYSLKDTYKYIRDDMMMKNLTVPPIDEPDEDFVEDDDDEDWDDEDDEEFGEDEL